MQPAKSYFASIELIRFGSAFLIVVFHAFYGWYENFGYPHFLTDGAGQLSSFGKLVENGFHNISLGVDMFFIISGFVITHILLSEKEKNDKIDFGKYFLHRGLRILPLFYIVLAITPLYNYYFHEATPNYLNYILGLGNFELINHGWGAATVNPTWTLCIEIQFYLLWPFAVAFIPKQMLNRFFVSVILISVIYRAYIFHQDNWWMNVYMHSLSRMDVIAIGSMIALWYHNNKNVSIHIPRIIRLMIYAVFIYVYFHDDIGYWDSVFLVTVKKYFYVGVLSFAFINYLFNPTAMFAISAKHPLQRLGKITYGLYIFNILVVALVLKAFKTYHLESMLLYYTLIFSAAILIAIISWNFIEKPFLNLKDNVFIKKLFAKKAVE